MEAGTGLLVRAAGTGLQGKEDGTGQPAREVGIGLLERAAGTAMAPGSMERKGWPSLDDLIVFADLQI